jgi:hypothetical protein
MQRVGASDDHDAQICHPLPNEFALAEKIRLIDRPVTPIRSSPLRFAPPLSAAQPNWIALEIATFRRVIVALDDWLSQDYRDVGEVASVDFIGAKVGKNTKVAAKQRQLVPELRPA